MIQAIKLGVARRILSAHKRCEKRKAAQEGLWLNPVPQHTWQARFYDYRAGRKRLEKLRYIHRNPVRRGLAENPEQWRWNSFRAYAYGETGPVRVNDWTVLKMKIRECVTFTNSKPKTA